MAYKLNTEKMSGWGTTRPNSNKDASSNSTTLGVYIDDNIYNQTYTNNIAADNPVYDAMNGDHCGVEGKQVQTHINIYHTCDLIVCGADGIENDGVSWNPSAVGGDKDWGNWRKSDGFTVNEHVLLRPDNTKISFSSDQSFEGMWDKITGNPIVSAVGKAASWTRMAAIAAGGDVAKEAGIDTRGIFLSQYQEIPTLSKISTLKMPSEIKFEFQFGQAGLFSAEEEVVKPVLALAKAYMPEKSKTDGNRVYGNAPSGEYYLNTLILGLVGNGSKVLEAAGDIFQGDKTDVDYTNGQSGFLKNGFSGLIKGGQNRLVNTAKKLTTLQNALYDAMDKAAQNVLAGNGAKTEDGKLGTVYKCVRYRIGRFVFPRLLVKSVTLDFDFSVLDEYGFPYKGSVALGGLESIILANRDMLRL